jgi:hypothetical protein
MSATETTPKPGSKGFIDLLEKTAKILASVLAIVAALAFIFPPVKTALRLATAWQFGAVGAVFYEIDEKGTITCQVKKNDPKCGALYLMKSGPRSFNDIGLGDVVQADSDVNFRDILGDQQNYANNPVLFRLRKGDCAIIFSSLTPFDGSGKVKGADGTEKNLGGWLKVGTTACGLFE